jgi:hypothetical protein
VTKQSSQSDKEIHTRMKKILALAIGVGIVLGTLSFAQDTGADKKMEKKKGKKKKTDDTSKH